MVSKPAAGRALIRPCSSTAMRELAVVRVGAAVAVLQLERLLVREHQQVRRRPEPNT
jgi:hypothetical protein